MTSPARIDTDTTAPFDLGARRQDAARHRTAIQHEVVRLLDALAPSAAPGRRPTPALPVTAHRWPNRCILQGATHAVSITWFAGTRDDDTLGELLVMTWRGRVSLPGSGQRGADEATIILEQTLLPAWTLEHGWGWRPQDAGTDAPDRTTDAVIEQCRRAADGLDDVPPSGKRARR